MTHARLLAALLLAAGVPALARPAAPDADPGARAARRFPQPVRVGDLIRRRVLRPVERQDVLGRVAGVVRRPDGAILVVVEEGGFLGRGARPVAVPVEAVALLGEHVALMDLTPAQLKALPTFHPAGATAVPLDEMIRIGLVRPFH